MQPVLFPDHKAPKRAKARHKADQRLHAVRCFVRLVGITLRHFHLHKWQALLCGQVRGYRSLQSADEENARQEAFLGALIAFDTFDPAKGYRMQTHIGTAAMLRLRTVERKRKLRGFTGEIEGKPDLSTIGEVDVEDKRSAAIGASVEQLRAAMKQLTNEEYLVVFHRRIAEMTGAEVAALLDTSVDDIDRIEAVAMERLGRLLEGNAK